MEELAPGLTQQIDSSTGQITDLPIKDAILRRMHYENRKIRDNLGVPVRATAYNLTCPHCHETQASLTEFEMHQENVHGILDGKDNFK
jgi:hypothetical protein